MFVQLANALNKLLIKYQNCFTLNEEINRNRKIYF